MFSIPKTNTPMDAVFDAWEMIMSEQMKVFTMIMQLPLVYDCAKRREKVKRSYPRLVSRNDYGNLGRDSVYRGDNVSGKT